MAKRRPTTDMNRDNWDQEEPPEERGEFVAMSEDEARKRGRKILKGRRTYGERRAGMEAAEGEKPNPFAAFSGFQNSGSGSGAAPAAAAAAAAPTPKASFSFGQTSSAGADKSTGAQPPFGTPAGRPALSGGIFGAAKALPSTTAEQPGSKPPSVFGSMSTSTSSSQPTSTASGFSFGAGPSGGPSIFGGSAFGAKAKAGSEGTRFAAGGDDKTVNGGSSAAYVDDKYAGVVARTTGAPEWDVVLRGDVEKRKSYVTAMTSLNEAFLWRILETTEIAEPVKALLTRAKLKDLLKMDKPKKASILTPLFAAYNMGVEMVEKDHPEFAVMNKKTIPGSGSQVQASAAYKKEEQKDSAKPAAPVEKTPPPKAEFSFKVPASAPTASTAPVSSPFGGSGSTFSFASGTKSFGSTAPPSTEATSTSSTSAGTGFSFTKPTFSFAANNGKPSTETKTTDTVTSTSEPPKAYGGAFGSGAAPTFSFGKKPDAAGGTSTGFSFGKTSDGNGSVNSAAPATAFSAAAPSSTFSFGKPAAAGSEKKDETAPKPGFSFGASSTTFSFGSNAGKPPGTSPFGMATSNTGFGSAGGFSFGGPSASQPAQGSKDDDEDYEPPVVEQKQIVEEGSFFQAKAKMFYKIKGEFKPKGVGFLFLKKLENGDVQVLMRADNATQNVVFNVKAVAGQQVQRLQKNNVLFICVANPPHDPKNPTEVTPVLLRTGKVDEADKLFEELKKAIGAKSA